MPNELNSPQIAKRNRSEKRVLNTVFITRAEMCYKKKKKKHVKRRRASSGITIESLCLLRSAVFTRETDRTLARTVSNVFMIKHLFTNANSCTITSRSRKWQPCLTLPTSLTSRRATFSPSQTFIKCFAGRRFNSDQPFSSVLLSPLYHHKGL